MLVIDHVYIRYVFMVTTLLYVNVEHYCVMIL